MNSFSGPVRRISIKWIAWAKSPLERAERSDAMRAALYHLDSV
jgi:hypothetical protein